MERDVRTDAPNESEGISPFHHNISHFILKNFRAPNGQVSIFEVTDGRVNLCGKSTSTFGGEQNGNTLSDGSNELEMDYSREEAIMAPYFARLVAGDYHRNGTSSSAKVENFIISLAGRGRNLGRGPSKAHAEFLAIMQKYTHPLTSKFRTERDAMLLMTSTLSKSVRGISRIVDPAHNCRSIMTLNIRAGSTRKFIVSDRGPIDFMLVPYLTSIAPAVPGIEIMREMSAKLLGGELSYCTNSDVFLPISPTRAIAYLSGVSTRFVTIADKAKNAKVTAADLLKAKPPTIVHRELDDEEVHFFNSLSAKNSFERVMSVYKGRSEVDDALNGKLFPTLEMIGSGEYTGNHPYDRPLVMIGHRIRRK